jgi:hypothetical protein
MDATALGQVVSQLGKTFLEGLRQHAADNNVKLEGLPDDPQADIPPEQIVAVLRSAAGIYFHGWLQAQRRSPSGVPEHRT